MTDGRYRQAKETKCGGMGGKESECLIVLLTQGNPARETLSREGGIGMNGTVEEKDAGNTEFRKRLNETSADSRAGQESTAASWTRGCATVFGRRVAKPSS